MDIQNIGSVKSAESVKSSRQATKNINQPVKDEFVKGNSMEQKYNENDNLKFKRVRIKFFDEDLAKMETMPLEEQVNYISYLKAQNRYIEIDNHYDVAE